MRAARVGVATVALAAAWAGLAPQATDGCGPDLPTAVFTLQRHPDAPLESFAAGRLGLIGPDFYQRYLVIAYRHLAGRAVDRAGGRALLGFGEAQEGSAYWQWVEVRRNYPGADSAVGFGATRSIEDMKVDDYTFVTYDNCLEDALRTAAATLAEREKRAGAGSPWFSDWLSGQDRVFANCSSDAWMPEPAPPGAPAWLVADRAYQRAAAHFYAGRFDEAARGFEGVAADRGSPWRAWAPYLVARAYTRMATVRPGHRDIDRPALERAEAQALRVVADPGLRQSHDAARRLLGFIRFRLRPEERLTELSRSLAAPRLPGSAAQDMIDLALLFDRFGQVRAESLAAGRDELELADWVLTFQSRGTAAHRHALERWQATRSLPWLVAAATHARGDEPDAGALIDAAGRVAPASPAFATLTVHRARLLLEANRRDEARALIDERLPEARADWPVSALNALLGQRLSLARSLDEVVAFAPRTPAQITIGWPELALADTSAATLERAFPGPQYFDADAAWILSRRLPLEQMGRIARGSSLPRNLRAELALATWVRAVVLERHDLARELVPVVSELLPETRSYLDRYAAADDDAARRFEAAMFMLNTPGVNPSLQPGTGRLEPISKLDSFRGNWWCAAERGRDAFDGLLARDVFGARTWTGNPAASGDTLWEAAALEVEARAAAADERARLAALPAAPNLLCREAIAWAEAHPEDPRSPQALHLAVRATRYGCADPRTTEFSRRAFQVLHRRFPKSEWAAKTKYYF
jgi:hypothetical protein